MNTLNRYAVVGCPVEHSLSPNIHRHFAQQFGCQVDYQKITSTPEKLHQTLKTFAQQGGAGVNITLPFKLQALTFASTMTDAAKNAGCANVLTFHKQGWHADNTDGLGLIQDLENHLRFSLQHKRIMILGAGGACRGLLEPLLSKAPRHITIANRALIKATHLVDQFSGGTTLQAATLAHQPEQPYDLIINASNAPRFPEFELAACFSKHTHCYDLNYSTRALPFYQWIMTQGCQQFTDGLGMLVEQAAGAYYAWHGSYPDTQKTLNHIKRLLANPT